MQSVRVVFVVVFIFHFVLMRTVLCQFVISSVTILRTVQISAGVRTYMGVPIGF